MLWYPSASNFRTQAQALLEEVGDDASAMGDNYGWMGEDL